MFVDRFPSGWRDTLDSWNAKLLFTDRVSEDHLSGENKIILNQCLTLWLTIRIFLFLPHSHEEQLWEDRDTWVSTSEMIFHQKYLFSVPRHLLSLPFREMKKFSAAPVQMNKDVIKVKFSFIKRSMSSYFSLWIDFTKNLRFGPRTIVGMRMSENITTEVYWEKSTIKYQFLQL